MLADMVKLLSWCIAQVRINKVAVVPTEGGQWIRKRRNPFCFVPIVVGNIVFGFRRVGVRVLHNHQWLEWESAVYAAMGISVKRQGAAGLLVPKFQGQPLLAAFDAQLMCAEEVIEVLALALKELYRLHQIEIVVDGKPVLFSHADASITNAIFDWETRAAVWVDFDLRHDLKQPASLRHADDLRAFTSTSIRCLAIEVPSDELFEKYMQAMKRAYPDEQVWQQYHDFQHGFWNVIDLFAYAQGFRCMSACRALPPK